MSRYVASLLVICGAIVVVAVSSQRTRCGFMLTKRPETQTLAGQKWARNSRQADSFRSLANMCMKTAKTQSELDAELANHFTITDEDIDSKKTTTSTTTTTTTSPKTTEKFTPKKRANPKKKKKTITTTTSTTLTPTTTLTTFEPETQLLATTTSDNFNDEDHLSSSFIYPQTVIYSGDYIAAPVTDDSVSLSTPSFFYHRNEGHGFAYASLFVLSLTLSICINVYLLWLLSCAPSNLITSVAVF